VFQIPDRPGIGYLDQSFPNSQDIEALQRGFTTNGVVSGCAVTEHSPAGMSVDVAAGTIWWNGASVAVSPANPSIAAAGASPRRDLVTVSSTGTVAVTTGTGQAVDPTDPYVVPLMPAIPVNTILLAVVDVPASASSILYANIVDKRVSTLGSALTPSSRGDFYYRQVGTSPLERYYVAGTHGGPAVSGTGGLAANNLFASPYVEVRGGTLDRLAVQVFTTGTRLVRVGIYAATSKTNLYPNNLVLDAGTISCASGGVQTVTISQALSADTLYWIAGVADGGTGTTYRLSMNSPNCILGQPSTSLVDTFRVGLQVAFTFAALPDPFPASATFAADVFLTGLRYSA